MSNYIDVATLERHNQAINPSTVPLTDFINGVDLEMWDENVKHMQECADGQYGHESAMVNFAKEWLQRADEISRLLAARSVQIGRARVAVGADFNS